MVHLWRFAFYVYVVLWNMEILINNCHVKVMVQKNVLMQIYAFLSVIDPSAFFSIFNAILLRMYQLMQLLMQL